VTVYLPTSDVFEEWEAEAALHGASVSRFIYELVDNATSESTAGVTPPGGTQWIVCGSRLL